MVLENFKYLLINDKEKYLADGGQILYQPRNCIKNISKNVNKKIKQKINALYWLWWSLEIFSHSVLE